jgi:hypothetical protein
VDDLNATLFGRVDVDGSIPQCRRGDQAKLRKSFDDSAGHRSALAHDANDVERQQTRDNCIDVRDVVVEDRDGSTPLEGGPIRHRKSDVLIVIQHSDAELLTIV